MPAMEAVDLEREIAVNRVFSVLEGTGNCYRWEAKEFVGGGFFGPRRENEAAASADDETS